MKIIEALKELKLIKKKMNGLMAEIERYSSRLSTEVPYFSSDEDQVKEVNSRIQSGEDLMKRFLNLHERIIQTNLTVKLEFGGKMYSIQELLDLRREIGSLMRGVYSSMNDRHAEQRRQQFRGQSESNMHIVRLYDEKTKNEKLRDWDDFLASIDARLEIVNATTDLVE